jgi:hypothetical protein
VLVRQRRGIVNSLNSQNRFVDDDDNLPEYDFSQGVRGKHYRAYQAGTDVVFLDPDAAKVFSDSASVNQALRRVLRLTENAVPTKGRPNKAPQATSRSPRKGKKPAGPKARRG